MQRFNWIVVGLIVAGVTAASDANSLRASDRGCGHVEEMLAARRAAEHGDSKQALEHLRKADALLKRCLRDGPPVRPESGAPNEVETG